MPDESLRDQPSVDRVTGTATTTTDTCLSCGSAQARRWSTPDGPALLCPPCATLHGLGCP